MAKTNWRDDYFHWCGFHALGSHFARKIWNAAKDVQRAAEVDCSIQDEGLRAYWAKRGLLAERRIRAALAEHVEMNGGQPWFARFDGDPRGCCAHVGTSTKPLRHGGGTPFESGVACGGFTPAQWSRLEKADETRRRKAS